MGRVDKGYILTENKDVVETTTLKAFEWRSDPANKHLWKIAEDQIGNSTVSTVFLCTDHGYQSPVPVLFETLVMGGPLDDNMERYTTYQEAVRGHNLTVAQVFNRQDD